MAREHDVVVFPTPPLPPTNIQRSVFWSRMDWSVGSMTSSSMRAAVAIVGAAGDSGRGSRRGWGSGSRRGQGSGSRRAQGRSGRACAVCRLSRSVQRLATVDWIRRCFSKVRTSCQHLHSTHLPWEPQEGRCLKESSLLEDGCPSPRLSQRACFFARGPAQQKSKRDACRRGVISCSCVNPRHVAFTHQRHNAIRTNTERALGLTSNKAATIQVATKTITYSTGASIQPTQSTTSSKYIKKESEKVKDSIRYPFPVQKRTCNYPSMLHQTCLETTYPIIYPPLPISG